MRRLGPIRCDRWDTIGQRLCFPSKVLRDRKKMKAKIPKKSSLVEKMEVCCSLATTFSHGSTIRGRLTGLMQKMTEGYTPDYGNLPLWPDTGEPQEELLRVQQQARVVLLEAPEWVARRGRNTE